MLQVPLKYLQCAKICSNLSQCDRRGQVTNIKSKSLVFLRSLLPAKKEASCSLRAPTILVGTSPQISNWAITSTKRLLPVLGHPVDSLGIKSHKWRWHWTTKGFPRRSSCRKGKGAEKSQQVMKFANYLWWLSHVTVLSYDTFCSSKSDPIS